MSNLTGRTEDNVLKKIEENPVGIQQAANVPGMPQFNRTRDLANKTAADLTSETGERQQADEALEDELDAEEVARVQTDTALQTRNTEQDAALASNAQADTTRAATQATKDTAQDTTLQQNTAADATRATAQTAKDAAQDTATTSEAQTRAAADIAFQAALQAALEAGGKPETLSGTSPTNAAFPFTFPVPYKNVPFVWGNDTWNGDTLIKASASNITKTGCTVVVKRTRAILIGTNSAFEQAPAGTAFQLNVIGTRSTT